MKNISVLIFIFYCLANMCLAQAVIEDFNDDDKLALWIGDTSHFIVNASHQLQLNNTAAGTSWIATSFASVHVLLEWNLYVRQAFAGSANNYGRVYLFSTQRNLTQPTEGYFLQLGEAGSNDAVELFRQSGAATVSVCRAANATIATSFAIRIKVTRDEAGLWKVFIDYNGGHDFIEVATGNDLTYTSGQWMGMMCVYTAGNASRFYYDDIYAGPPKPDPLPPEIADPFDVVINEFFPDPSPPLGLPEQEFVEIYNRSDKTFDLDGWKLGDATSLESLPQASIKPGEYFVIRNSSISLNNSGDVIKLIDDRGVTVDSLSYALSWYQDDTKSGGGYSIERLNPETSSTDVTNWYVSQSAIGGTPGERNSVFGRNPDSKAPVIRSITLVNDSTIAVSFTEPVVVNKHNYQLVGMGVIDEVVFNALDSTVIVKLRQLVNGTEYRLDVSNYTDLAGNIGVGRTLRFTFFIAHPVHPKDILITELMVDPAPVVQMPEAEYLELYNRSAHPVSLSGWHIEDATTRGVLPSVIIMPNTFMLLTSTANASKFGGAVGVTSFPSLGNISDKIVLRDGNDIAIDSISYNTSWYHSGEKADGGWSLELIDINNPCGEGDNWTASEDIDGGTPGEPNSVFADKPDVTPPTITRLTCLSPDSLEIVFNERLSVAALDGSFSMAGRALFKDHSMREIYFVLDEPISPRIEYQLTITGIADCNGNVIDPTTRAFSLPEEASINDVVINEVLFNPRPNGADFIEVYNRTAKYIDLKDWSLSGEVIATTNDVLAPYSFRVFTSSIMSTEINYPLAIGKPMSEIRLPSLPDDEGTIVLTDGSGVIVDQFSYMDDMHSPVVGDTEGVSLERISFETPTNDVNNWHSASGSVGFATPGYLNSSTRSLPGLEAGVLRVVPEVINPSSSLLFAQVHYQFERPGLVANVSVVDLEGRVIKTIATNETIGAQGFFQWDGDRDAGGIAATGYYMVWFQTFDLDGLVKTYRRRVVVGF